LAETIHIRRREIADYLRRTSDGNSVVVVAPDHPLVMRSVDVLVGGPSGVTAIVMSSAEEVRRPHLLQSRLTLNKVALPPETRFVYVARSDETHLKSSESFSAVVNLSDRGAREELSSISANPHRLSRRPDTGKIQRLSERRFADTYRLSRILQRHRMREGAKPKRIRSRSASRDRFSNGVEAAFFLSEPTPRALLQLTPIGTDRWFRSIEGEPEPTGEPAGIIFAFDYPRTVGDPDKVLRASAFAGWVFAPSDASRPHEQIADLVARFAVLK
jgi:hypothetical protein